MVSSTTQLRCPSLALACMAALAWAAGATGCERSAPGYYGTTEPRHGPDEVWSNLGAEPEWIDPGKCSDASGGTVLFNLFAGLTQPHPANLRPMPDIASSWEVSEDGRRYLFHLREATWSDGRPLTAADFEYSWKRVLDRATASKYASFLYPLENGEAYNRGALLLDGLPEGMGEDALRAAWAAAKLPAAERIVVDPARRRASVFLSDADSQPKLRDETIAALRARGLGGSPLRAWAATAADVGVRALDERTLEARLVDPLPYFLDLTMFYTAMPVPRHVLERLTRAGQNPDLWTRPEHIVTNGAFVLEAWKFRQYMLLRRNPRYWDAGNVKIERVKLAMVESNNTTLNLYEAGELDYIGNSALPSEFLDHLSKYRDFESAPYLGTYFLWLNTKVAPLNDRRVRKALSLSIDRKALVEYVTRGGQIPSADLVPDGVGGYAGLKSPLFDPEAARRLLHEAGYDEAHPPPPIVFRYNTSEGHKQIAEALQQMWRKHLGVRVEIENQEWKVYLKSLKAHDFQIARLGWIGDYADPFTFLELLSASNGNNHSNWSDPEYERLLRAANATLEPTTRLGLLRKAEQLVSDETPLVPLYVYTRTELRKPYLMGHWLNYQNRQLFKYWWIDERWYTPGTSERLPDPPPPFTAFRPARLPEGAP